MSDEKEVTTPEEKTPEEEETPKVDDETGETQEKKPESEKIDYEAIIQKEKEARELAEKKTAELAFKLRDRKRKEELEEEEEDDEDKPVTAKQLASILSENEAKVRKELRQSEAESIASRLTGSDSEKQAVIEIFRNRNFPDHLSLEEQVEEAYVIANRKRIIGENAELKRALRGKEGINDNPASTFHDSNAVTPKLPKDVKTVLTQQGFVYNNTTKRYEKKIAGGKTMLADANTGKVSII